MKLTEQVVLITGGGSGIGLAIAKEFLKKKSRVIICGRNLKKLEDAKSENPLLTIQQCDVSNEEQVKTLSERCKNEFGGVTVLINNAGAMQPFNIVNETLSLSEQLSEIEVNFSGAVKMIHYFLPDLLKKPESAIVNVSSALAFVPFAADPIYSGTKAALHAYTQSIRWQLATTNVKVFELMPPLVDTELVNYTDVKKMSPEKLAQSFMAGFEKDNYEITPGQAGQLKMMRRVAPGFIFKVINKQP